MKIYFILILCITQSFTSFGQTCSPDSLLVRDIKAFATDNNIDWEPESRHHQIFLNPDCNSNDKLLVHLVGSFDTPSRTTYFPTLAANNGFKVIVLKYPNSISAVGACSNSTDIDCFSNFRQEIVFGEELSPEVDVDASNSIFNRLLKLLIHLNDEYPLENWTNFLSGADNINWNNIVLSGHSQGGGHAAYIAKKNEVNRVLMFAAPNDFSTFSSASAPWTNLESATPDSLYYAFGNLFDEVVDFDKQFQIWQAMNMLNEVDSINVDISSSPYNNSKVLYTRNNSSTVFSGNHNGVVIDDFTPILGGEPVFVPVWKYMLGLSDIMTSITATEITNPIIKVFPNPTSDHLFFESKKMISQIEVYNVSGKLLEVFYPNSNRFETNLESYKGLLILKTSVDNYEDKLKQVVVK